MLRFSLAIWFNVHGEMFLNLIAALVTYIF